MFPAGLLHVDAEIVDRQVVLYLEPARLLTPGEFFQGRPVQAGDQLSAFPVQPVDHFRQAATLVIIRAIEITMLVEQLQAQLSLAFAGKEQSLHLGEAQDAIVGVDGLQNALITLCQLHRWRIFDSPIAGDFVLGHAPNIATPLLFVSMGVSLGLDDADAEAHQDHQDSQDKEDEQLSDKGRSHVFGDE